MKKLAILAGILCFLSSCSIQSKVKSKYVTDGCPKWDAKSGTAWTKY
jgi:hypothetical protein